MDTKTDTAVVYELRVVVTRAVRPDNDSTVDETEGWMVSREARRELEREVLQALRKLDGDCDCEVLSITGRCEVCYEPAGEGGALCPACAANR